MYFNKNVEQATREIVAAFQKPERLPAPLAQIFIHRKDAAPCREWSWRNQLIAALRGHSDARGYRQWQEAGRQVKKGEKAFHILIPCIKKSEDEKTGEEKVHVYGFKGMPVFGLGQTQGDPLPPDDPEVTRWIESLPLLEVARRWGLNVEAYNGNGGRSLGQYRWGVGIALGVKNLSTWGHEMVHAADHRNGKLTELGQHWRSETVAELGGAVLLKILGFPQDADLGGCWKYIAHYAAKEGITALQACGKVLDRTCEAVALILDTAEEIAAENRIAIPLLRFPLPEGATRRIGDEKWQQLTI